jgi:hypothetical protein
MVVVRVKMIGKGTDDDPYRAPLPTHDALLYDYSAGTVLTRVPESDLHDEPQKVDPNGHATSAGHHVLALDDAGHKKWHAHLDDRYQEHKGEFRPEVV